MNQTKVRILDAAEKLFADHGIDVSLRAITSEAGVNLAAVNYHFQSKDALVDAILERRIGPINQARFAMLDELEREFPDGPLPLDRIIAAFIVPVIQMEECEHIRILFGRTYTLPDDVLNRAFSRHLRPVFLRFSEVLERALPHLPAAERTTCILFTAGAMVHVMAWSRVIRSITEGSVDPHDTKTMAERMIAFATAGFQAAADRNVPNKEGAKHA